MKECKKYPAEGGTNFFNDAKTRKVLGALAKIIILLTFILVAVFAANVHEPWSDEAQSFLVARDNSFGEIFIQTKYEGTPPLWFYIVKIFIMLGGTYETLFILPIIFTVIGLIIFEFKIKAPWYVKILLPFTYFILFQYTVIARSYCMVFPALMWIASIYNKRDVKKTPYTLALLFLMSICSYTLLIAGSLWLLDALKLKESKQRNKKDIILSCIILLALIATFILILPNPDYGFTPYHPANFFDIIYQATIGSQKNTIVGAVLVSILFLTCLTIAVSKEKNRKQITIDLIILFLPIFLEHMMLKSEIWHIGIITILLFAAFMMNDMINRNYIIKFMILIICLTQTLWSAVSIKYDIDHSFSAATEVVDFIKQNNFETVYSFGFDTVAIQPYFDHNIFDNQPSEKSFRNFSVNNGYIEDESLLQDEDAVFIISENSLKKYKKIYKSLKESGRKEYHFNATMYTKTFIYEPKGYFVFVK